MQTNILSELLATEDGREADAILRSCVHCGFCTATCPTYQLLGDELDGPRGRIYLIKSMLEGDPVTARTQLHLDRCLTCRSCETTCPSGVHYSRLLAIGRGIAEQAVRRDRRQRLLRKAVLLILPHRRRFSMFTRLARGLAPVLPARLRSKLPAPSQAGMWPAARHRRRMLILEGCVQPVLAPNINAAMARVLDRLGISLIRLPHAGCCGAVHHHLGETESARAFMRANIDAWWPHIEAGAEAIVTGASACALELRDYAAALSHDPAYAARATRVAECSRDVSEVLAREDLSGLKATSSPRVAFHAPCTLTHGLNLHGVVAGLLADLGFDLTPVADSHLCCGSAGTYSLLQPELAEALRDSKVSALTRADPEVIATANIGCLNHLQSGTDIAVKHWIELLDTVEPKGAGIGT